MMVHRTYVARAHLDVSVQRLADEREIVDLPPRGLVPLRTHVELGVVLVRLCRAIYVIRRKIPIDIDIRAGR